MAAADLLRSARTRARLTQRELARRTGVSQGTIARVETGETEPRLDTLEQLLAACGMSLAMVPRRASEGADAVLDRLPVSARARVLLPVMTMRIVQGFAPDRIVLFGSQAKGTARSDSDVDLLVVLPRVTNRRAARIAIRTALADLPIAKDILVVTPDEVVRRGRLRGTVLGTALADGVTLYAATS